MKNFAFFVLVVLVGCGTHSGNPDLHSGTGAALGQFGPLIGDLCEVGVRCRGVNLNGCGYATSELVGLPDAMGAPAGKYRDALALLQGLGSREVVVNATAHDACRVSLRELACESPLVATAFPAASPPFDRIDALLGVNALCGRVIETP